MMRTIFAGLFCYSWLLGQVSPPVPEKIDIHPTVATIEHAQLEDWESNPPEIQALLEKALNLTKLNLKYLYGSADPSKGGLDCSGTMYYLLTQSGLPGTPRDASGQYIWVRKEGLFRPVFSTSNDTFELSELRPGNLLFWMGTYDIQRDPPITHVMLYLGLRKSDHHRIMVGASEGRYFDGIPRNGVSVFDFQLPGFPPPKGDRIRNGAFIGYASIPDLPKTTQATIDEH